MNLTRMTNSLNLTPKIDFQNLVLKDINAISGLVDVSQTSLHALLFPQKGYNEDFTTQNSIRGIQVNKNNEIPSTSGMEGKGFIFDLKKDYKLSLASDITDHYTEENFYVNDHVANRPIIIDVIGQIGEKTLEQPADEQDTASTTKNSLNLIDSYSNRLGSLPMFAPTLVNQALDIKNTASKAYSTYENSMNLFKSFKDSEGETKKQTRQYKIVYEWFYTWWSNKCSFTVVTPYGVFYDMFIMNLEALQGDTKFVTDLKIQFKQLRKAKNIDIAIKVSSKKSEVQKTKAVAEQKEDVIPETVIRQPTQSELQTYFPVEPPADVKEAVPVQNISISDKVVNSMEVYRANYNFMPIYNVTPVGGI